MGSGGATWGVGVADGTARGVGVGVCSTAVGVSGAVVRGVAVGVTARDAVAVAVGWPVAGTVATITGGRSTGTYSVGVGRSVGVGLVAARGVGDALPALSAATVGAGGIGDSWGSARCTVAVAESAVRGLACSRGADTTAATARA